MNRLLRWASSFVAVVSALLFLATCAMWVRSFRVDDQLERVRESISGDTVSEYRSGVFSGEGRISIATVEWSRTRQEFVSNCRLPLPATEDRFGWSRGSFRRFYDERDESFLLGFGSNGNGTDYDVISFPHWFLAALLTAPLLWFSGQRYHLKFARPRYLLEAYGVLAGWGFLMIQMTGVLDLFVTIGLIIYVIFRTSVSLIMHFFPDFEPGRCTRCGYDLRATPDRCPECGAVPNTKATT